MLSTHDALVELYLFVKVRDSNPPADLLSLKDMAELEPAILIKHIRESVETIISQSQICAQCHAQTNGRASHSLPFAPASSLRVSEPGETGSSNDYEQLLQKLEGDIRKHIALEQQMQLHIEHI